MSYYIFSLISSDIVISGQSSNNIYVLGGFGNEEKGDKIYVSP